MWTSQRVYICLYSIKRQSFGITDITNEWSHENGKSTIRSAINLGKITHFGRETPPQIGHCKMRMGHGPNALRIWAILPWNCGMFIPNNWMKARVSQLFVAGCPGIPYIYIYMKRFKYVCIYIYINICIYIYIIKWLRECHDHDQQPAVTTYRVEWKSKRQPRVISAPDPPSTTQAATQVPRALRRVCAPSGGKMLGTPDIQFSHLNLAGMNEELLGWRIEVNPNKLAFGKDQSFCGTGGKWSGKLHMTCRLCWESHWIVWVLIMSATQSSPASTPQQVNPWLSG